MRTKLKRVELTPQEKRLWADTLAALSWIAPGFIHIAYTLMHRSKHPDLALFTNELNFTAATDGYQYIFNPKRFFKYNLMERCFIFLHETMHEILNHVAIGYAYRVKGTIELNGKVLPFDLMFANIMMDYVINAILIASKLGQFNPDWLFDLKKATDADSWIEAYFKNWKSAPKGPDGFPGGKSKTGTQQPEEAEGNGRFDDHMEPGESEGADPAEVPERNQSQWEIVVKQGMEIQQGQGSMPAALKQFFEELLAPKVDWTQHIRGLIVRLTGSGAYDFRRLDRRLIVRGIGAPAETGRSAGLIIVGGDSSGSIFHDPSLTHRFLGEIAGMLEDANPEEVHVIWCDAIIQRVDICTDVNDVRKMAYDGVPGGGGTDLRPVFDYVEEHGLRPDILIYLTDGDALFPATAPDYPVVFGDISGNPKKYPFGTVVHIPTNAS